MKYEMSLYSNYIYLKFEKLKLQNTNNIHRRFHYFNYS